MAELDLLKKIADGHVAFYSLFHFRFGKKSDNGICVCWIADALMQSALKLLHMEKGYALIAM